MERAALTFTMPVKKGVTTRLWKLCEDVAAITGTKPNRWLRAGEWTLQRALDDLKEMATVDVNGYCKVKNRGAYLTWLIKHHSASE